MFKKSKSYMSACVYYQKETKVEMDNDTYQEHHLTEVKHGKLTPVYLYIT